MHKGWGQQGDHAMAINSTRPSPPHHVATPRAPETSNGKAADSPAFVARARAEASEAPFGLLVSEIAKSEPKTKTEEEA
jgi:hypothetical protein